MQENDSNQKLVQKEGIIHFMEVVGDQKTIFLNCAIDWSPQRSQVELSALTRCSLFTPTGNTGFMSWW